MAQNVNRGEEKTKSKEKKIDIFAFNLFDFVLLLVVYFTAYDAIEK